MLNAYPKPRPKILDKRDDRRAADALKRLVYDDVDARDLKRCRVCQRRGNPYATTALGRIHRVHILDASRGGTISPGNIFSGCWLCHALIHAKQLFVIGTDARYRLEFEIHEAAVVEVFGAKPLPAHVRIITTSRF